MIVSIRTLWLYNVIETITWLMFKSPKISARRGCFPARSSGRAPWAQRRSATPRPAPGPTRAPWKAVAVESCGNLTSENVRISLIFDGISVVFIGFFIDFYGISIVFMGLFIDFYGISLEFDGF